MSLTPLAEKIALLRQSFLFAGLDCPVLENLAEHALLIRYAPGQLIVREGDPGESLMVIKEGIVRISAQAPTARVVVLGELSQGDVFGEIALLDGGPRSADAHAQTNCTLLELNRRALLSVISANPSVAIGLIEILCARLRRSDQRMMEIGFLQLPPRLARAVLRLASGAKEAPAKRVSASQSELADMVGGTRENVNRCLRKWQKSGWVELTDGWLIVLDRAALVQVAGDD